MKSLLTILDMKPLGYAHDLGLAPDGVGGRFDLRASFAFPLVKTLLFRQIALSTKGTLDGVAAAGVVGSRNVTDGALDIALDKVGMTLSGTARLSGVPVGFDWRESFLATDKIRSHISFTAEPNEADRIALALAPPDGVAVKGKIAVKGAVTIDRARTTTLDATADVTQADVAIDKFGIRKPAGEAGTTDLSLVFDGDTLRHVPRVKIAANSLNLAGQADFGADGSLQHAVFSRFASKRDDFTMTVDAKPGAPQTYIMSLKGAQLDVAPLLAAKSDGQPPTHTPHLELTVGLDRLLTGVETKLDQVAGTATLSGRAARPRRREGGGGWAADAELRARRKRHRAPSGGRRCRRGSVGAGADSRRQGRHASSRRRHRSRAQPVAHHRYARSAQFPPDQRADRRQVGQCRIADRLHGPAARPGAGLSTG